ncbi:MAG: peptidoglycan-binding protein [Polyangiaceae bacterium]
MKRVFLTRDGELSEDVVRRAAVSLATYLVGGDQGLTKARDPEGCFKRVVEGREDYPGYMTCEDLHGAWLWLLCGEHRYSGPAMREAMEFFNRMEAWGWNPGETISKLRRHAGFAWREYLADTDWDIKPGDVVQVSGRRGAHTLTVVEVHEQAGLPVALDHADYGHFSDADRDTDLPVSHTARVYRGDPIVRKDGSYCLAGLPILGRLDSWALMRHLHGIQPLKPALVPEPFEGGQVERGGEPLVSAVLPRVLRLGSRGDDVRGWQRLLALAPTGDFDHATEVATRTWQRERGLLDDGVVGPATRSAARKDTRPGGFKAAKPIKDSG